MNKRILSVITILCFLVAGNLPVKVFGSEKQKTTAFDTPYSPGEVFDYTSISELDFSSNSQNQTLRAAGDWSDNENFVDPETDFTTQGEAPVGDFPVVMLPLVILSYITVIGIRIFQRRRLVALEMKKMKK